MHTYTVDPAALYLMQLYTQQWYRWPPQLVNDYLRAGATIREARLESGWVTIGSPTGH